MKGDVYQIGDKVVLDMEDFVFHGYEGTVTGVIDGEIDGCQPYRVNVSEGINVITCACKLHRPEPEVKKDWYAKVPWKDCAWRPHLGTLPKLTFQTILQQIEIAQKRRRL